MSRPPRPLAPPRPSMIWFDFGGVLSPPLDELFASYEKRTGILPSQLWTAFEDVAGSMGLPPLAPVELALLTEREWGARLRTALAGKNPGIDLSRARLEEFGAQWFDGAGANTAMVGAWRLLRRHGLRTGVLTNNVAEWGPHWKRIILPLADGDPFPVIDSCEVGHRKPDPEIYAIAAGAAGCAPEDCLLVDDSAENVAAARAQGWQAVRFTDNRQTLEELRAATGLAVLTSLL